MLDHISNNIIYSISTNSSNLSWYHKIIFHFYILDQLAPLGGSYLLGFNYYNHQLAKVIMIHNMENNSHTLTILQQKHNLLFIKAKDNGLISSLHIAKSQRETLLWDEGSMLTSTQIQIDNNQLKTSSQRLHPQNCNMLIDNKDLFLFNKAMITLFHRYRSFNYSSHWKPSMLHL